MSFEAFPFPIKLEKKILKRRKGLQESDETDLESEGEEVHDVVGVGGRLQVAAVHVHRLPDLAVGRLTLIDF